MTETYSAEQLARFFGCSTDELHDWINEGTEPSGRAFVRHDVPRIADPTVPDFDLATRSDVCSYLRITKETLRRWIIDGKFPKPDGPMEDMGDCWFVGTVRNLQKMMKKANFKKAYVRQP